MVNYVIPLMFWATNIYISNTTGMEGACCPDASQWSLFVKPGSYKVEFPTNIPRIFVYTQQPLLLRCILETHVITFDYKYDNIMFWSWEATTVNLTKMTDDKDKI